MTWARLDDSFHHHPKRMKVGLAAVGLYALGLSYSADNLTDGRLPERWVLGQMVGEADTLVDELIEAGMWEKDGDEYVVHDFEVYNLTRSQWEAKQNAGRLGGLAKADGLAEAKQTPSTLRGGYRGGSGPGSGSGKNPKNPTVAREEFEDWLADYHAVTGRTVVRGSRSARDQFASRRQEFSAEELKLATRGCHGDEFCREHGHDVPETILRASKVTRYIERARPSSTLSSGRKLGELVDAK